MLAHSVFGCIPVNTSKYAKWKAGTTAAEQGATVEPRLPKVSWEMSRGQACSNEGRTPTVHEREAETGGGERQVSGGWGRMGLICQQSLGFCSQLKINRNTQTRGAWNNLCRFCCVMDLILEKRQKRT